MKLSASQRGFTLLEVLIALAIVAMSVGALLGTVTSSASNVIYLKDKTLAEWVALNRLTELRIDKSMPDTGKRSRNTVMGGMRWEWQEEVVEMPMVDGMLRIEIRAHATGEFVDDSRPVEKPTAQKLSASSASGSSLDKVAWTTTVTGIVSRSRSDLTQAAPTMAGNQQNPGGTPGGTPGGPGAPGSNPGSPNPPGTPNPPGSPGNNPPKTPSPDR